MTWTVMGGPLRIHLLTQPTLGQLLKKMQTLFFKDAAPQLPPSWTLGYHLCRSVGEDPSFRQNFFIKPMLDEGIPFDSDCIDDQLFDSAFHWKKISPMYSVDDIVNDLTSNGKDFILPLMIQTRSRDDQTDEVLCESMAIAAFLADICNLAGTNAVEKAKANEIVLAMNGLFETIAKILFSPEGEKAGMKKKLLEETLPQKFGQLEGR